MKRLLVGIKTFSALSLLLLATNAQALPIAGDFVKLNDRPGYGSTDGGEFIIDVLGNSTAQDYFSFCLEVGEHISYDTTYKISSVTDYATNGGVGSITENSELRDYLSDKTKWVFWSYYTGAFSNYIGTGKYFTDTNALANEIQKIIWNEEQERLYSSDFYNSVINTQKDFNISGGIVKVLNLTTTDGITKLQSQIIAEPVPEPATMLLFGTGLVGLTGLARRRKK